MHEQHDPNNKPDGDENQLSNESIKPSPEIKEAKWFQENTAPLQSLEPTDPLNENEKEIIASIIKHKTIVGFGEACHWHSHEAQQVKDRLFRHLVEEHDFRVFAMEDSREACKQVNKLLNDPNNSDTAEEITKNFGFGVWKTREMGSLIGYIKDWNTQNSDDPISVIGIDANNPLVPLQKIKSGNLSPNDSDFKEALEELEIAIKILSLKTLTYEENGGHIKGYNYRDEQMYNFLKKFHQHNEEKKIFLWAHNEHISKKSSFLDITTTSLGERINQDSQLKAHYAAIGFCHDFKWQDEKGQENGLPSGSFEEKIIELSANENTIMNLNQDIPFAEKEGEVNIATGFWTDPKTGKVYKSHSQQKLRECFDGMIYLNEANLSSSY